jgi:hypothetical protein
MSLEPYTGPACGNCGRYFQPGEEVCPGCGAHRYGDQAPVVGPLARRTPAQKLQENALWIIAGAGTVLGLLVVLGLLFGLFHLILP